MINSIIQYSLYLIILVVLAIPLGKYIGKVMNGEKVFLSKILNPIENFIYKILRIDKDEEMDWKKYSISVIAFSVIGFVILFLLQMVQGILPLNPEGIKGMSWHLSFNTASSFVTNTNWQSYSGESQATYLTQMIGLTVQNFVSAAAGIAVLFALIRGFTRVKEKTIGNFWVDATRSTIHAIINSCVIINSISRSCAKLFIISRS